MRECAWEKASRFVHHNYIQEFFTKSKLKLFDIKMDNYDLFGRRIRTSLMWEGTVVGVRPFHGLLVKGVGERDVVLIGREVDWVFI